MKPSKLRLLSSAGLMSVSLALAACGGGGTPTPSNISLPVVTPPPPPATTTATARFTGSAVAGLAACDLSLFGPDGLLLATGASGADGRFDFTYETTLTPPTGFARLEANNCTYADEYTGDTITGASLSTVFTLPTPFDGSNMQLTITPLTRLLDDTLAADAGTTDAGDYDAALHAEMVASLSQDMLGSDEPTAVLTVQPAVAVDAESATAGDEEKAYGLALAAVSAMGDLDESLDTLNLEATGLDAASRDTMIDAAGMFELTGRNETGTKATVALAGLTGDKEEANTAPEAANGGEHSLTGFIGDTFSVDLGAYFIDGDGDELSVSVSGLTEDMSLTGNLLSGRFVHDGTLKLAVTAYDGRGGAAYIDFALTSSEAPLPPANNVAPVAGDDSVTLEDTTASTDLDVLSNDTDADGDTLQIVSVSNVGDGISASVAGDIIRVTGIAEGSWTFDYTVEDGKGGSDTATVTVHVPAGETAQPTPPPPPPPPNNSAPVAKDDAVTLASTTATVDVDVLANDTDADGDTLVLTDAVAVGNGISVSVVGNKLRVTGLQEGLYNASYTVSDGNGGTAQGLLEVLVPAAPTPPATNTAPVGVDDHVTLDSTTATLDVDVLANDTDADGDTLTINGIAGVGSGITASIVDDKIRVTGVMEGDWSLTYSLDDNNGASASAQLTVTVPAAATTSPPPPPPPATGGSTSKTTARGTIGGFGSIIVNGQRYETDTANVTVNDTVAALEDLAVGQWVTVEADVPATGDPIATSIVYEAVLLGPVQEVTTDGFTVLGQTINVTDDTVFESDIDTSIGLSVDELVEVSAIINPDGTLDATYVEMADDPTADYSVKGDVTSVDAASSTFTINGLTVSYSGDAPAVGQAVKVKGKTITSGGTLNASEVEVKAEETAGEAGQFASVTGVVEGDPKTEIFEIGGVRVSLSDATVYSEGYFDDMVEGARVSIGGIVQSGGVLDGVLLADTVEFRLEATHIIDADIESIDATNGTFTIRGAKFSVNAYTAFKNDLDTTAAAFGFGDFAVGDIVRVQAHAALDGRVIANTLRKLEYKNGDVVIDGPISAVTAEPSGMMVSVLDIPMTINANTVMFDAEGNFLNLFELALNVGDDVEIFATDYDGPLYVDIMTWFPAP